MTQKTTSRVGLDGLHAAMAARVDRREMPGMVILIAQADDVYVDAIGVKAFDAAEPRLTPPNPCLTPPSPC